MWNKIINSHRLQSVFIYITPFHKINLTKHNVVLKTKQNKKDKEKEQMKEVEMVFCVTSEMNGNSQTPTLLHWIVLRMGFWLKTMAFFFKCGKMITKDWASKLILFLNQDYF